MMRRVSPEVVAGILAGALSGVAGALLFATLHAIIIVPIWGRMTWGLIFGAIAGAAAGWSFAECFPEAIRTRTKRSVAIGAGFGALLWLAVAPVTGADAFLRAVGLAPRYELLAVAVAVVLALAGGGALGWQITRRSRGALAGAAAGLLLTIAMAGPVPVGRGSRALNIFLAVFPAAVVGGIALSFFSPSIFKLITRGREVQSATSDA
jgi:hypothetical protein